MNDEYVLCERSICDKLYDRHKMYDFLWTNQSYPSISNALLKQLNVFLRLLNKCWMTFIQWCSTDDIPYNLVIVDISNSYPNVLLNDTHNTFAQYL